MKRLSALLGALALAGCATAPAEDNPGLLPGARYVAMGSSFAAGAGIGPIREGTPPRCGRTTNNYPTLLAARLDLALDDQSCGGAKTAHITGAWNELAPQIDALWAWVTALPQLPPGETGVRADGVGGPTS